MVETYLNQTMGILYKLLPKGWEKVVLYAEIDIMHYNIFFYVKHNETYYQCYNLDKICETKESEIDGFAAAWYEIALKNKENEDWTAYTLTVDASGKFEVEYFYGGDFEIAEWKKKYLS